MRKIQITDGMFLAMIVNCIFAKAIGVTQGTLARAIGQDMWIAVAFGTLQGILMMMVTYHVIRKSPERNFIGIAESLLGKWFAILTAILMLVFFIAGFGPVMITFVYHLRDYFLTETPIVVFIIAPLLVGSIGCFYGLEVMARIAVLGMMSIFMLNALIIAGSTNEFDIRNLLPLLEAGLMPAVAASIHYDADWAQAIMLAGLIMPLTKDVSKRAGKYGVAGIITSGILISIWAILESAVLSAEVTGEYTISCMKLARNAHIGQFLHRYEMIMIALYSLPAMFVIMFYIYGASVSLTKMFRLKKEKAMIVPACLILGAFSYWIVEDHFRALDYLEHYWPVISLPIACGLPLLLLALQLTVGRWRKAGRVSQES